jgi:hypothetical protein
MVTNSQSLTEIFEVRLERLIQRELGEDEFFASARLQLAAIRLKWELIEAQADVGKN